MTTPQATTGTHAPGCYYVNTINGAIQRQCNPLLAAALGAAGYVGQNGSWPPEDPFPTFEAAQKFLQGSGTVTGAVTGWTDAVGNFFGILTQRQTLVRFAEGIIGIALVVVAARVFLQSELANVTVNTLKGKTKK